MEIKIGIANVAREVAIDVEQSAAEVAEALRTALAEGGVLTVNDAKGRTVHVPAAGIAYVDCGQEHGRTVGFGSL